MVQAISGQLRDGLNAFGALVGYGDAVDHELVADGRSVIEQNGFDFGSGHGCFASLVHIQAVDPASCSYVGDEIKGLENESDETIEQQGGLRLTELFNFEMFASFAVKKI